MKKVAALIPALSFLAFVPQAFAQEFNACAGQFQALCNIDATNPGNLIGKFVQIFLIVAILACLFFLIYGGIRWITSGGDEKQVEAAKSHVVAALVGLVIALAAFFILAFVGQFFGVNLTSFNIPTLTVTN